MSTGPVYCPDCKNATDIDFELVYTTTGYQCPSCKYYWDAKFPIKLTKVPKVT